MLAKRQKQTKRRARQGIVGANRATFDLWHRPVEPARGVSPQSGFALCDRLTLYHDAQKPRVLWRQKQVGGALDFRLTIYQFDGEYLSLAAGLPIEDCAAIVPGNRVEVVFEGGASRPLNCFLRLNLTADEHHEVLHEAFVFHQGRYHIEFDPSGLPLAFGNRLSVWLDIIFSQPAMCEINIASLDIAVHELRERAP